MGLLDWLLGPAQAPAQTATGKRARGGLTVADRRQSRQRQLADLNERIALEEARAKVRTIKARGRAKVAVTTSPIASVRETLEEAFDLADSLRGGGRRSDYDQTPQPAADQPVWERLLNSPAGLKLAEAMAPALAPMLANILTPTATAVAAPGMPSAALPQLDKPEPVPSEAEEHVAVNLIASVVQFVHLEPAHAAGRLLDAANSEAAAGRLELLEVVTNASRMPLLLVRAVANRYRTDATYGEAVTYLVTTPGYLDTLLRCLRETINKPPERVGTF